MIVVEAVLYRTEQTFDLRTTEYITLFNSYMFCSYLFNSYTFCSYLFNSYALFFVVCYYMFCSYLFNSYMFCSYLFNSYMFSSY